MAGGRGGLGCRSCSLRLLTWLLFRRLFCLVGVCVCGRAGGCLRACDAYTRRTDFSTCSVVSYVTKLSFVSKGQNVFQLNFSDDGVSLVYDSARWSITKRRLKLMALRDAVAGFTVL